MITGMMNHRHLLGCLVSIAAILAPVAVRGAEPAYQPGPENLAARAWFQDARFGLFIHWGIYSQLGDGEWVMNNHKMTVGEYEPLAASFNPTKFDAAAWVSLAKAAGMHQLERKP